jgi:hypothetical protein
LQSALKGNIESGCFAGGWKPASARRNSRALRLLLAAALLAVIPAWAGQAKTSSPEPPLPEAPQPPAQAATPAAAPCPALKPGAQPPACPAQPPLINWYERFTDGPHVKPLTPKEKGWLAIRNVVDPFNAVTILSLSAISVGSDADSPYGPGVAGFGRSVGVSYTQDITGEFFGTFLIPSIVHQDPHYHRLPRASIPHRVGHAILQVAWTQGDNRKGMPNYANLFGYAIDDEISNLYVPGRQTNLPASAQRYATGLATAPIDNFITEFLPDLARHIHIHVVLVQQIVNQVARTGGAGAP